MHMEAYIKIQLVKANDRPKQFEKIAKNKFENQQQNIKQLVIRHTRLR